MTSPSISNKAACSASVCQLGTHAMFGRARPSALARAALQPGLAKGLACLPSAGRTGHCIHAAAQHGSVPDTRRTGATPGYSDQVIFGDGTFIDGSTAELSADGPLRPPYVVYCQVANVCCVCMRVLWP